jgi:exodeoxyribonuclease VII small subunit
MEPMQYETAVKRLEEIVALLEKGGQTLDESVKLFEEGASLAAFCNKALKEAELKITKLSEAGEENDG